MKMKKILILSIVCLMSVAFATTYSRFQHKIVGTVTATHNGWQYAINIPNGTIENDHYKVPISGTSGSFNVTIGTTSSNENVAFTLELSGTSLPSDIKFYEDSSFSTVIKNNKYEGLVEKGTTNTVKIYYKSASTINGYVYVKGKATIGGQIGLTLYNYIASLSNNGVDTSINFSSNPSSSNGLGLNIVSGTENKTYPIRYFRGNVTNNNVIFANYCWKIVRTTETGGVKMIYNGVPTNGQCSNRKSATEFSTNSAFASASSSPTHVGYMYGQTTYTKSTLSDYKTHLNDTSIISSSNTTTETIGSKTFKIAGRHTQNALSSAVKKSIDTWYQTNILGTEYESKLEDTVWCNDRTISTTNTIDRYINQAVSYFYFSSMDRASKPTLTCSRKIDKFTVSSSIGNGDLEYPIGLITIDEYNMSGTQGTVSNGVGNGSYLNTGVWYWSMTPRHYKDSTAGVAGVYNSGGGGYYKTDYATGVRPAISLSNKALVKTNDDLTPTGNGSATSPIIIK